MRTPRPALEQTPISHVLERKPRQYVVTVSPGSTVQTAATRMHEHGISCLLVVDGATVLGVVTDRDCTRHLAWTAPGDGDALPIRRLMNPRVVVVEPTFTVAQCLAIMCDRRVRHLPVIEDVAVVGIVSRGDLLRFLVREDRHHFQDVSDFILDVQPGMRLRRTAASRAPGQGPPRAEP